MDDDLTIKVSEDLHQQAADLAAARGATVETVVREAIAQYVSTHAPEKPLTSVSSGSRTELGARLKVLRKLILDTEISPLGWEDLRQELAERRVAAAITVNADEFVTSERASSPLLRVRMLPVRTIQPAND